MPGFQFRHRPDGVAPTILRCPVKGPQTVGCGDIVKLESGGVELGQTGDTNLLGAACEPQAGATAYIDVIVDTDAVYGVADAYARAVGAFLDLNGGTGAQGLAPASNEDFVVFADSSASDETLVSIKTGRHHDRVGTGLPREGARLNSAIAQAVLRVHREFVGRGPAKAEAFFRGNVVVVVMEDVMTTAERSLVAEGRVEAATQVRRELQLTMQDALVAAVEGLVESRVVALMSDNNIDPDLAVEVFVLDRPVPGLGGR